MTTPDEISDRASSWCQPIRGGAFAGEAARADDRYQNVLIHVGRLQSVHGETCDWEVVYRAADALLCEKTKDLTILGALCAALLERESVRGLAAGLRAFRELVEQHGAELHPPRKRGRAGAFSWFTARLEAALPAVEAKPDDHIAWTICRDEFAALDELLRAELEELQPRVGPVREMLARGSESTAPPPAPAAPDPPVIEKETAPPAETQAAEAPAAAITPPVVQAPAAAPSMEATQAPVEPVATVAPAPAVAPPVALGPIESEDEAQVTRERVARDLRRLARFYFAADATRAEGYQSAIMASFLGAAPDGQRAMQGPSPRVLRELQAAADAGAPALARLPDLLETDFTPNVLRQLARALEACGETHRSALRMVVSEALAFYLQHDGLIDANPDTIEWLESLREGEPDAQAEPDATADPEPPPAPAGAAEVSEKEAILAAELEAAEREDDAEAERLSAIVARAEQATARDGLGAGCVVIQQALERTARPALRFHLRLALARLCADHGAPEVALPVLRALYDELSQPVREWDPHLLVEVAAARLGGLRALAPAGDPAGVPAEVARERDEMQRVLALVDPERAVREK